MTTIERPPSGPPTCPSCGATVGPGAKFCAGCGAPAPASAHAAVEPAPRTDACPSCGVPVRSRARFCPKCGVALVSPRRARVVRVLRRAPVVVLAAASVVGIIAVAALFWLAIPGGEPSPVESTLTFPGAVSADPAVVARMQKALQGFPTPEGATDAEQVRSLLGLPDAFEVSYELDEGGRSERMVRYETWYYFELQSAFEFVDGGIISNMPIDDVDPLAILPRQYTPEMFRREMKVDDVRQLLAARDGLVQIDAPAELGVKLTAYYGEQLMVVFDEEGLALVQTLPLQAGGEE